MKQKSRNILIRAAYLVAMVMLALLKYYDVMNVGWWIVSTPILLPIVLFVIWEVWKLLKELKKTRNERKA